MKYDKFIEIFLEWTRSHKKIEGSCIVGSYARGQQTPESDVDAMIFSSQRDIFFADRSWLDRFGDIERAAVEFWGRVQSLRVFYKNGLEIEFGFDTIDWANIPIDSGTFRVVSDGMKILYDPTGKLSKLQAAVKKDLASA